MSAHTPGPWTIKEHSWSDTGIYGSDGRRVALIDISPDATEENQDELEATASADARLIASSPLLLAALKEADRQMEMAGECLEKGLCDEALLHLNCLRRKRLEAIEMAGDWKP